MPDDLPAQQVRGQDPWRDRGVARPEPENGRESDQSRLETHQTTPHLSLLLSSPRSLLPLARQDSARPRCPQELIQGQKSRGQREHSSLPLDTARECGYAELLLFHTLAESHTVSRIDELVLEEATLLGDPRQRSTTLPKWLRATIPTPPCNPHIRCLGTASSCRAFSPDFK